MDTRIMENLISRAEALTEALPYMQLFSGKYFVVKYGGQAMVSGEMMATVVTDLILLKQIGIKPVLVHGGGNEINEMMRRLGKKPHFVGGLRVTDDETMEIAEMVLQGKVNRHIVALLNRGGARAVGLSGGDAGLFQARKKPPFSPPGFPDQNVDLGRVGEINRVDISLIEALSEKDYIPVISSIGTDSSWESLNINADHAAGELAGALRAEKLIILTDVEGVYRQAEKETGIISAIKEKEIQALINGGQINGGMIPKVEACLLALKQGAARAHIIDGRRKHALILEIFTDAGIGTMVTL